MWDTMIAEKVLAGNRKLTLSLDEVATRRGLGGKENFVSTLIKAGICPSEIPQSALQEYCEQDVALTEQIFLQQRVELKAMDLLPVMYSRCLVTPVLADIEFNGMYLDAERVKEAYDDYSTRYKALSAEFQAVTGGVNFKSPKQLGEYLYDTLKFPELLDRKGNPERTEAGGRKTDKHTIPRLEAVTDEQRKFKTLAGELAKLRVPVQNLEKMKGVIDVSPQDPRIFAQFNQARTDTHRLSSTARNSGFQFQNVDRAFKRLFRARKSGWSMVEIDGSQLEFRVAAFLGRDATAKADILSGADVHAATAKVIGCSRQDAKAWTFKPLFGGRSGTPKQKAYIDYFNNRYSGISRTQARWAMDAAATKQHVTEWGLRFYYPDAAVTQSGYVNGQTQIYNYPIQSLATACIIPLALRVLWDSLAHLQEAVLIVNTVHDSVIAEVRDDVIAEYVELARKCFTETIYTVLHRLYGMKFDVPLGLGVKAGEFWGEGTEQKYEAKSSDFTWTVH